MQFYITPLKKTKDVKMEKTISENKMGVMKIPKLLFSTSIPIIISMIVQALYNVVDSIFVSQYDNVAGTGALTVAFPVQNLMIALSVGLAVGTNALLSRSLGQKNREKASLVAGQGFVLTAIGYLVFLIFGLFLLKPFVASQAEGDSLLYQYSMDYLSVICIFSFGVFIQVVTERLLQATGRSVLSMIVQMSGAITNIILDPILIFGYLGAPEMGVKGAAVATVIGQMVAALVGIVINIVYNKDIDFRIKNFIPKFGILREMLIIGIPSVIMQAIGSVMTFSMNKILYKFSIEAMNVFGIYFKLQSFVFMPIFGLTSGMIPIVAYNFGAKNRGRVNATIKLSAISAMSYMALGLLVFQLFPEALLGLFNSSDVMTEIGKTALRTISFSFVLAGFAIVGSCVCQALGKSIYSLFVSVGRQLVVLIPTAFLLSLLGEVKYVWWAFPIAEVVSLVLAIIFLIRVLNKCFAEKEEQAILSDE